MGISVEHSDPAGAGDTRCDQTAIVVTERPDRSMKRGAADAFPARASAGAQYPVGLSGRRWSAPA
ncbi:hypothetical protein TI01_1666 [Lysobacter sp. A03]|nr:hypothetical protein TI01_1666 [Lysobacter sp. A03]